MKRMKILDTWWSPCPRRQGRKYFSKFYQVVICFVNRHFFFHRNSIMSKLVATSLEQLSRMCWATCWAMVETAKVKVDAAVLASQGEREWCGRPPVDVRLNFVVGDAIDTCDAICLLSSEGFTAWGNLRENAEVCIRGGLTAYFSGSKLVLTHATLTRGGWGHGEREQSEERARW